MMTLEERAEEYTDGILDIFSATGDRKRCIQHMKLCIAFVEAQIASETREQERKECVGIAWDCAKSIIPHIKTAKHVYEQLNRGVRLEPLPGEEEE